jgi:3D (Asp-Asp-Asp) domain-containing protein
MNSSRPSSWQTAVVTALVPIVGMWPSLFVPGPLATRPAEASIDSQPTQHAQYFPLPKVAEYAVKKTVRLTVTAYSSTVDQTDGDPFTTASGFRVRDGVIAHNVLPFGTRVRFPDTFGDKVFVVLDRLHQSKGYYIADIWMPSRELALQWGAPILTMEILGNR